jgi:DNA-binding transcriptional LysR family regulator
MTRNLDIDVLRTFAAVADSGGFTRAADLVSRTQSAVSVQIRRLEETLGARVFERTSRSLALTPAGRTLLEYARRILALNDESVRRIAEPPVAGVLRIGITEYFVPGDLPRILARFASEYPHVELEVHMGLSRDLRGMLPANALDVAIVRRMARDRPQPLWTEAQLWVAADSFVAPRDGTVPLVLLPSPCVLRTFAVQALERSRRAYKVAFTGSSMTSVVSAVAAGLGVSIVPRSAMVPGLRTLSGRGYPNPGSLDIVALRRTGTPAEIVAALERVIGETLGVIAANRR